jgi:hypothetical protein
VADHDVLHAARSIEQDADLSADIVGKLGQLSGELIGNDSVFREASAPQAFERFDLAGLEAGRVAMDLDGVAPGAGIARNRRPLCGLRRCAPSRVGDGSGREQIRRAAPSPVQLRGLPHENTRLIKFDPSLISDRRAARSASSYPPSGWAGRIRSKWSLILYPMSFPVLLGRAADLLLFWTTSRKRWSGIRCRPMEKPRVSA